MTGDPQPSRGESRKSMVKLVAFALLAGLVVVAYYYFDKELVLRYKQNIDGARQQYPVLVYGGAFLAYVVVTGLSLPGAAVMSLLYASLFGFWQTVVLVSFASTSGATIAFLLSRYLLRDMVQDRFGRHLTQFNEALEREGAFYLFTLRLIPAVPFFVINLAMGLTPLRVRTFWWVSQVGMLPGTCAYCFAGSQFELERLVGEGISAVITWQVFVAFALLGVLPLAMKKLVNWLRRSEPATVDSQA